MNAGIAFILFGVMLLATDIFYKVSSRRSITVQAVIVGYKQFPTDKLITHNNISRTVNFSWLRVVEFIDPKTGEKLCMVSNPAVRFPEQIGTTVKIDFNPNKVDPIKDYVWIHNGFACNRALGITSLSTGFALLPFIWLVPASPFTIHFSTILVGFAIVWGHGLILFRRQKCR